MALSQTLLNNTPNLEAELSVFILFYRGPYMEIPLILI